MAVVQNQIPNEPELKDLLERVKKDIMLSLNCHHVATIQSFNALKQTATATINYKKTFFQPDPTGSGNYVPVLVDYPLLADCPVIFLGGGGAALTFPVAAGDECVVLYNDRDIDNWFSGGGGGSVNTNRRHDFADGLILVGVRSLAHVLLNVDTSRAVLRGPQGGAAVVAASSSAASLEVSTVAGGPPAASVTVTSSGVTMAGPTIGGAVVAALATQVKIANQMNGTLGALLQNLCTQLENLATAISTISITTTGGPTTQVGTPTVPAVFTAYATSITSIAGQLSGLLA